MLVHAKNFQTDTFVDENGVKCQVQLAWREILEVIQKKLCHIAININNAG